MSSTLSLLLVTLPRPLTVVLLLGPHYAVDLGKFQDLAKPYGVAVAVIPQDVYGALDGARILEIAMELAKQK